MAEQIITVAIIVIVAVSFFGAMAFAIHEARRAKGGRS